MSLQACDAALASVLRAPETETTHECIQVPVTQMAVCAQKRMCKPDQRAVMVPSDTLPLALDSLGGLTPDEGVAHILAHQGGLQQLVHEQFEHMKGIQHSPVREAVLCLGCLAIKCATCVHSCIIRRHAASKLSAEVRGATFLFAVATALLSSIMSTVQAAYSIQLRKKGRA